MDELHRHSKIARIWDRLAQALESLHEHGYARIVTCGDGAQSGTLVIFYIDDESFRSSASTQPAEG